MTKRYPVVAGAQKIRARLEFEPRAKKFAPLYRSDAEIVARSKDIRIHRPRHLFHFIYDDLPPKSPVFRVHEHPPVAEGAYLSYHMALWVDNSTLRMPMRVMPELSITQNIRK